MRIENWILDYYEGSETIDNAFFMVGNIYEDEKLRFPDGHRIHTSKIMAIDFQHNKMWTKNNEYKLGKKCKSLRS